MVAVIVVARGLADRFRVPYAIVLTGCGLIYAVLPLPVVHLEPEIVLWLIIPPLLYAAARARCRHRRPPRRPRLATRRIRR